MKFCYYIYTETEQKKEWLLKKGLGLVLNSGIALLLLLAFESEVENISPSNPLFALLLSALTKALIWFVPLVFAGIGVNVISEAILRSNDE